MASCPQSLWMVRLFPSIFLRGRNEFVTLSNNLLKNHFEYEKVINVLDACRYFDDICILWW